MTKEARYILFAAWQASDVAPEKGRLHVQAYRVTLHSLLRRLRDAQGRRHRRAFSDRERAEDFQKEQQALAVIQRTAVQLAESIQHDRPARQRQYQPLLEAIAASYDLTHTPALRERR